LSGLGVHRGRWLLATPEHEHALSAVHGYLAWATPLVTVLAFLVAAQLAALVARGPGRAAPGRLPSRGLLWFAATASLLGTYAAQETIELAAVHGHLPVLADLVAEGGWVAIPLALLAGGAISLLLRGAERLVRWAAGRSARHGRVARLRPLHPRVADRVAPASLLARRLAGRAPPLVAAQP
jgi:hypothetical protein